MVAMIIGEGDDFRPFAALGERRALDLGQLCLEPWPTGESKSFAPLAHDAKIYAPKQRSADGDELEYLVSLGRASAREQYSDV